MIIISIRIILTIITITTAIIIIIIIITRIITVHKHDHHCPSSVIIMNRIMVMRGGIWQNSLKADERKN